MYDKDKSQENPNRPIITLNPPTPGVRTKHKHLQRWRPIIILTHQVLAYDQNKITLLLVSYNILNRSLKYKLISQNY